MKSEDIKKNIVSGCIKCNTCLDACPMLRELGNDFFSLLETNRIEKGKDLCTLCSLCNEVCPRKLDIKGYYENLKKEKNRPLITYYAKFIHKKRLNKNEQ